MTDLYQIINWPLIETAQLMVPHLKVTSFFAAILVSFFLVVKLYSSVPIRLIPPPVVTKADPLFRLWTQEWQSLTYRIRAILDVTAQDLSLRDLVLHRLLIIIKFQDEKCELFRRWTGWIPSKFSGKPCNRLSFMKAEIRQLMADRCNFQQPLSNAKSRASCDRWGCVCK
ncbi:hypothetical protein GHT06_016457 [Daphnia sinensis]|uniref:Uncharacterized protein n=1 Tax=Daphnia sinensis TaxID=1820382 RepID=A0AAD5PRF9_9CRUS|nr:hypothetical protein GHT06_005050 [Daphnia sinensis]KAI9556667.1 hypothetical protein GHT06_016457 [Daphnia sinensis]